MDIPSLEPLQCSSAAQKIPEHHEIAHPQKAAARRRSAINI
jgi:hypothetical protein